MEKFDSFIKNGKNCLKWIVLAFTVGCLGGIVGSLFHIAIEYVTHLRLSNKWIIYCLPAGGVLIALMYGIFKKYGKLNTDRVIRALRGEDEVPFILAPLIFTGALITHLVGGSAGREGAALQLGGSIGYRVGKITGLSQKDMGTVVMTGMASVFSALFGTPVTAAVFALEVSVVGLMNYRALFPCVAASLVAYLTSGFFDIAPVRFEVAIPEDIFSVFFIKITLLSVLLAFVSVLFLKSISGCNTLAKKYIPNPLLRGLAGGAIILVLTLLDGTGDYNGAGMNIIEEAMGGNARCEAFLMKILFTVISIAAGFKGGEIVPTFFIGSTFGCVGAALMGLDPSVGAAVGFVVLFCCVVNCPLASIVLAFEVFGGDMLIIFALCCSVGYVMSGNYGLYKSQKIVYSKLNEHYADANAK